jgi:GT2 family glycosyltransferase
VDKKTIAILAPCYSGDFDKETLECIKELNNNKKYKIIDMTIKEVYIHRGRRMLLEELIKYQKNNSVDYVLWLDSDVRFKVENIDKLIFEIKNNEKIKCISGIYFNRHENHHPMFCKYHYNFGYDWNQNIPEHETFVVDGIGFGFFLLPIETIIKYCENYKPTEWFDSSKWYPANAAPHESKYTVGEDLHFCRNLKSIGINVYVSKNVLLDHNGITYEDYLKWKRKSIWLKHCEVKTREW